MAKNWTRAQLQIILMQRWINAFTIALGGPVGFWASSFYPAIKILPPAKPPARVPGDSRPNGQKSPDFGVRLHTLCL